MFVVEDKPVDEPSLTDEAAALLQTISVGQSFLIPAEIVERVRDRAKRIPGRKFKTRSEGTQTRIGRVT